MNKQFCLPIVVIALGLSACNDETLPTEAQGNLLKNPSDAVLLEDSEYSSVFDVFYAEAIGDTVKAIPPAKPIPSRVPRGPSTAPGTGLVHETDEATGNVSKYKPAGSTHISSGTNQSKYVPSGFEHIKEGSNESRCQPPGTVHIEDEHNRSLYKPTGTEHISAPTDRTKYKPTGWTHFGGPPAIDKSKYIPVGYVHIQSGTDQSKYCKPTTVPADTVIPGTGGGVSGSN